LKKSVIAEKKNKRIHCHTAPNIHFSILEKPSNSVQTKKAKVSQAVLVVEKRENFTQNHSKSHKSD